MLISIILWSVRTARKQKLTLTALPGVIRGLNKPSLGNNNLSLQASRKLVVMVHSFFLPGHHLEPDGSSARAQTQRRRDAHHPGRYLIWGFEGLGNESTPGKGAF